MGKAIDKNIRAYMPDLGRLVFFMARIEFVLSKSRWRVEKKNSDWTIILNDVDALIELHIFFLVV